MKPGLWEREIPAAESGLLVDEIPQPSILEGHKGTCVAISEKGKSHL